jgi:protease I
MEKSQSPYGVLYGKKVAILATDGFEESELLEPFYALQEAGAEVDIVSPKQKEIVSWNHKSWGKVLDVDVSLNDAVADDYDALVLPGGVMNPDALRVDDRAVNFVKQFVINLKPIGAICHGPWTLINAYAVNGRTVTSWPSLEKDLVNAGAKWVDQEVVEDRNLVTSRKPQDLPAFNAKLISLISRGVERETSNNRFQPLPTFFN